MCFPASSRSSTTSPGATDVTLMLLTGNTRAGARAKLSHYGLDGYFASGAFCERPVEPRRDRTAGARARRHGDRVYVIGDTPHDVRCGKAIDARTVGVASGGYAAAELEAAEAWLVLDRLPDPIRFRELLDLA